MIALIGQNGSGKSTLLSFMYADNPKAYSANVRMFGVQRGKGDNIWDVKSRIGFVSTELQTYFTERISCFEAIGTGLFDTKYIARKLRNQEITQIEALAAYFEVSALLHKKLQEISFGEQRLILFIRALVKFPSVLLLDEPYLGFDGPLVRHANALLVKLAEGV